jgi:hypothetical protein
VNEAAEIISQGHPKRSRAEALNQLVVFGGDIRCKSDNETGFVSARSADLPPFGKEILFLKKCVVQLTPVVHHTDSISSGSDEEADIPC